MHHITGAAPSVFCHSAPGLLFGNSSQTATRGLQLHAKLNRGKQGFGGAHNSIKSILKLRGSSGLQETWTGWGVGGGDSSRTSCGLVPERPEALKQKCHVPWVASAPWCPPSPLFPRRWHRCGRDRHLDRSGASPAVLGGVLKTLESTVKGSGSGACTQHTRAWVQPEVRECGPLGARCRLDSAMQASGTILALGLMDSFEAIVRDHKEQPGKAHEATITVFLAV